MPSNLKVDRRRFGLLAGSAALLAVGACARVGAGGAGGLGARAAAPGAAADLHAAFQPLVNDHAAVNAAMQRMLAANSGADRSAAFATVKRALEAHAFAEENSIYPAVMRVARDADGARDLFQEHALMKVTLFELAAIPVMDQRWDERARRLQAMVQAHARDEETDEFPALQRAMNTAELDELARLVQRDRSRLLSA